VDAPWREKCIRRRIEDEGPTPKTRRLPNGVRGALVGMAQGSATFVLTLFALSYFYVSRQTGPGSYLG
jgi:hypothetical protein